MKKLLIVLGIRIFLLGSTVHAIQDSLPSSHFTPPEVRAIDEFGVNLVTGQVDARVNTVQIGGERGLSHHISLEANSFSYIGQYGYFDKYNGRAVYRNLGDENESEYGMIVSGPLGTEKFKVMINGEYIPNSTDASGYYYEAFGDKRNILEESEDRRYLVWTKPDGTELYYYRPSSTNANDGGALKKIIYPNGFSYFIESFGGVSTNTGYEIKYIYQLDERPLSGSKQIIASTLPGNAQISGVDTAGWSKRNPKYYIAINKVFDSCDAVNYELCDLQYEWPTATVSWPGGMPQAMYLGDSVVEIEDASGAITKFKYRAHDVSLDENGDHIDALVWAERQRWSPRIVAIKSASSTSYDREYKFINAGGPGKYLFWVLPTETGVLTKAWGPDGESAYQTGSYYSDRQFGGNFGGARVTSEYGIPYQIWLNSLGQYNYSPNHKNQLLSFVPMVGRRTAYFYDARGNLEFIKSDNSVPPSESRAYYPSSCPKEERKRCNKPIYTIDAENNRTDYEYHQESGQIAKVTYPAAENGVRPESRYYYEKKYARYKNKDGNYFTDSHPLWVLKEKRYCIASSAQGENCVGDDEIITRYDYGADGVPNNLHLRSVEVTDSNTGEVRLTCYQYDRLGNRIAETLPKSQSTTCQ